MNALYIFIWRGIWSCFSTSKVLTWFINSVYTEFRRYVIECAYRCLYLVEINSIPFRRFKKNLLCSIYITWKHIKCNTIAPFSLFSTSSLPNRTSSALSLTKNCLKHSPIHHFFQVYFLSGHVFSKFFSWCRFFPAFFWATRI